MRSRDFNILLSQVSDVLRIKIRATLERGSVRINHPNETCLVLSVHWSSSNSIQVLSHTSWQGLHLVCQHRRLCSDAIHPRLVLGPAYSPTCSGCSGLAQSLFPSAFYKPVMHHSLFAPGRPEGIQGSDSWRYWVHSLQTRPMGVRK